MTQLVIFSRDSTSYQECLLQQSNLCIELLYAGQAPAASHLAKADIILGEPDLIAPIIGRYPNVKWVQSTWAGNNKLQNNAYKNYLLTGVKGIFAQQMTEYVLAYLLYFQRNIETFNHLKSIKEWAQPPSISLAGKTLGIMGIGNIGQVVGEQLRMFGLQIIGLSQTPKSIPHIPTYISNQLHEFAGRCDYIVSFLPETNQSKGLCNAAFFNCMRKGSIFINAGRGSVIDQAQTLIHALASKHLFAAVLDVFEEEPLLPNHPYYSVDNLYITCHTAAVSDPQQIFDIFANNLILFLQGKTLLHQHDFKKGY